MSIKTQRAQKITNIKVHAARIGFPADC